jgi:D-alanyl-D-alanine carboxypeptidase
MFQKQIPFRSLIFSIFFFGLFSSAVSADAVDSLVRERMQERNIPGVALAVVKNGRVEKLGTYGYASLEFDVPVSGDSVFEIGSVSKQMTAAAIMLLVEEGKVKLDEKISAYLPNTPDSWRDVTVRHLLTHTSGIKSYTGLSGFELSRRLTLEQFIKQLSEHELEFTPGERNIYSNSGFNLLAYIVQSQSGKPFMDFMRERIFLPLGMTRTADRDPRFMIKQRVTGYEWRMGGIQGRDGNLTDLMGAGAIVSTINDMIKWEMALRGDKFLKPESKKEMWTQFTFNNGERSVYGFGWRIADIRGHRLISHTGQTAGFGAAIFRYVEQDVTVIFLSNNGEVGLPGPLAANIAKVYIPTLALREIKTQPDPETGLAQMLLAALKNRIANKPDAAVLSAELVRSLSNERARSANDRIGALGPISSFELVEREKGDETETLRYLVKAGKRLMLWRFVIDTDGKITEMVMEEED